MASGMATRVDLKDSLTLEEAYQAYEVLELKQYHAWLAQKQERRSTDG